MTRQIPKTEQDKEKEAVKTTETVEDNEEKQNQQQDESNIKETNYILMIFIKLFL